MQAQSPTPPPGSPIQPTSPQGQPQPAQPQQAPQPLFQGPFVSPDAGPGPSPEQAYGGAPSQRPGYDFIAKTNQPVAAAFPGANLSLPVKIAAAAAGLLILVVIANSLFSKGPDFTPYISVAQDQQSMFNIVATAGQKHFQDLNTANKNFAFTAQGTFSSNSTQIVTYLGDNGKKVAKKSLGGKISTQTYQQLESAAAAQTYNQTFQQIMNSKLDSYMKDLSFAYEHSAGSKGKALLKDQYTQAQLLKTQLNSPAQ